MCKTDNQWEAALYNTGSWVLVLCDDLRGGREAQAGQDTRILMGDLSHNTTL